MQKSVLGRAHFGLIAARRAIAISAALKVAGARATIVHPHRRTIPAWSLFTHLNGLRLEPRMVVIERNGEIIARDRLAETPVAEGDTLEIVQMMAGG